MHLGERDHNCIGENRRLSCLRGFIRSGPEVTSVVATMKMITMAALIMMPVRGRWGRPRGPLSGRTGNQRKVL